MATAAAVETMDEQQRSDDQSKLQVSHVYHIRFRGNDHSMMIHRTNVNVLLMWKNLIFGWDCQDDIPYCTVCVDSSGGGS